MIPSSIVRRILFIGLLAAAAPTAFPQSPRAFQESRPMHATGSFDVTVAPQKPDNPPAEASGIGRMSIDKVFHGSLEATSKGEMLASMSAVKGSAGYVALEKVTGTLDGLTGSFVLQHLGIMDRGQQRLTVIVVPDSGTGQLTGILGSMAIDIKDGKHLYTFDYTIKP
jgi:hypothetical protein